MPQTWAMRHLAHSAVKFSMDLIRYSINRPIAILAAVVLVMLFGGLALTTIPIQLSPSIAQPQINLRTTWRGAAPEERLGVLLVNHLRVIERCRQRVV